VIAVDYLVVAIVAGLAAIERKGFLQAMLSRPVALAPITGLALGDPVAGLMLGPPLELLWLGAVNLGAALPPHEALGAAAITGGAVLAGRALGTGVTPAVAVVTVALVERDAPRAAVRANLYGLLLPFAVSFVLAPLGAAAAAWLVPPFLRWLPDAGLPLAYAWAALGGFAAAAGARAFRSQRGLPLFASAAALTAVLGTLAGAWP
jgi:PTS system mannose-specific IIC component